MQVVYVCNNYYFIKLLKNLVNVDMFFYNNLIFTLPSLSLVILLNLYFGPQKIWKINLIVT